jgi:methylglyoxal/glyoxal reductase
MIELSLVGLEYIDQILIHWPGVARLKHNSPQHASERLASWVGLQQLKLEGLVRSLGVSNFEIHHLEHLRENSGVVPDVNQVELHPRYQQVVTLSSLACSKV